MNLVRRLRSLLPRVRALRAVVLVLAASALIACNGPTEWESPLGVPLAIQDFAIDELGTWTNGVLLVRAASEDLGYQMPIESYVTADVSVAGGDAETLRLSRDVCGLETGQAYSCRRFLITLRANNDLREFTQELHRFRARLTSVSAANGYRFGSAWAFGERAVTMQVLAFDDRVERVEASNILLDAPNPGVPPMSAWLSGAVPFEVGIPKRWDGVLTVRDGDTVTARYTQPSGGVLETTLLVDLSEE